MSPRRRDPEVDRVVDKRLEPGFDGLEQQRMAGIQRARLVAAMAETACERGVANVTVAHVVARSGVSRRTFYEIFGDREDCCLAAFDEAVARVSRRVLDAYDTHAKWVEKIRASLLALLLFLDEEPYMGRLAIVESLGAGPVALKRRELILARIVAVVDDGRREAKPGSDSPPLMAEGVVGAVFSVIHGRMLEDGRRPFADLLNPLMAMIVLPFLGDRASRRELARTAPSGTGQVKPARPDPLSELDMRLTYRTMRVLLAIGSHPGSSNRGVAEAAGIGDQGQMSKLLARLVTLTLIENVASGPVRGAPNAWRLTSKGEEIEHAIAAQSSCF
jgi:AcrR family transcriptional regulator/DNA-binding MarR family transcriptional regulator